MRKSKANAENTMNIHRNPLFDVWNDTSTVAILIGMPSIGIGNGPVCACSL